MWIHTINGNNIDPQCKSQGNSSKETELKITLDGRLYSSRCINAGFNYKYGSRNPKKYGDQHSIENDVECYEIKNA